MWWIKVWIEVAVHAMNDLFAHHSNSVPWWGVLLVDASNAFRYLDCFRSSFLGGYVGNTSGRDELLVAKFISGSLMIFICRSWLFLSLRLLLLH